MNVIYYYSRILNTNENKLQLQILTEMNLKT